MDLKSNFDFSVLEDQESVWWNRVETAMEVRLESNCVDRRAGSAQVCRYMRQALRLQVDRQFIFGLLICGFEMRIFFSDRSGVMGTKDWIDMSSKDESVVRLSTPQTRQITQILYNSYDRVDRHSYMQSLDCQPYQKLIWVGIPP